MVNFRDLVRYYREKHEQLHNQPITESYDILSEASRTNMKPDTWYVVTKPFDVWLLTGHRKSNASYGNSRIMEPVYVKSKAFKGSMVCNLPGGRFYAIPETKTMYEFESKEPAPFSPFERGDKSVAMIDMKNVEELPEDEARIYARRFKRFQTKVMESVELEESKESLELAEGVLQALKAVFTKHFPKSRISGEFSTNLSPSIHIRFYLGNDRADFSSNIPENDPMIHDIFVWMKNAVDDQGYITGPITLERSRGSLSVTDPTGRMAFNRVKIPFRKTTGDGKKVVQAFEKYLVRLKQAVKDNVDNISVPFDVTDRVK